MSKQNLIVKNTVIDDYQNWNKIHCKYSWNGYDKDLIIKNVLQYVLASIHISLKLVIKTMLIDYT